MPRRTGAEEAVITLVCVALLVLTVCAGLLVAGLFAYATADNVEFMDGQVADAATTACGRLDAQLRELPPQPADAGDDPKGRRLEREAALMRQLVSSIETVGAAELADDIPSQAWLADWRSLADARVACAKQVAAGRPGVRMREPQTPDHYPISQRMKVSAPGACGLT